MRRLQTEMNRLFQAASSQADAGYPAMNVYASPDGVAVMAEIPGVAEDELDISVHRDTVTLKGERRTHVDGLKGYHRRERVAGAFLRTLSLPFSVDPDRVEAHYRNGVLHMSLHRPDADKPKRISVNAR
ncbi:Hsp20/alpha crystallin family protein [Paracoccus sp. MC1854]|uniref:Hsp20/alpha crystallin family protein n=1 Tax=Paracoccus sp. MC1854 TaxID=2760306 RepID=UPI001C71FE68|nr:Hsp20/alpha crystallin family protein [Paracoccus sp. MC1854]